MFDHPYLGKVNLPLIGIAEHGNLRFGIFRNGRKQILGSMPGSNTTMFLNEVVHPVIGWAKSSGSRHHNLSAYTDTRWFNQVIRKGHCYFEQA
jgi:hypothetical protein